MTQETRTTLKSGWVTNITDGGSNTAAELRAELDDIADSAFILNTDTSSNITFDTVNLDATPATDHSATGITTNALNAGTTIAAFELCYLASDGEWALADADADTTSTGMFGLALEAGTDGNPLSVALAGSFVRDDTWNWTVGGIIYVSTTAGGLTQTAPSGTGDIVRVVGYAVSADVIYFNPDGAWVEVA